jgi:NTP pyrophosphatase (non-canonical NTP hydrolase)
MDMNQYQTEAMQFALFMDRTFPLDPLAYTALGVAGEAGEYAEKVKKFYRDHDGNYNQERINAMVKELGGVLWYLAAAATVLGVSLSDVAKLNLAQLNDRKARNVLHGEGDNR